MNEEDFNVEQELLEDPSSGLNASEAIQQVENLQEQAQAYAAEQEAVLDQEQEEIVDPREKESWGIKG
jgi:hypothetical protein